MTDAPMFRPVPNDDFVRMSDEEKKFVLGFVERIEAYEKAYDEGPPTTDAKELAEIGITLPAPSALDDAALTGKLWEVIRGLAQLKTYLSFTDHLTDRELYTRLHEEILQDEHPRIDPALGYSMTIDVSNGEDRDPDEPEPFPVAHRDARLPKPPGR